MSDQTRDQIAAVMLQKGTPEQQAEALEYAMGRMSAEVSRQKLQLDYYCNERNEAQEFGLEQAKELEELKRLNRELLTHIKTTHLDMGGKHRYAISHDAYTVIEPLRQLVNGAE